MDDDDLTSLSAIVDTWNSDNSGEQLCVGTGLGAFYASLWNSNPVFDQPLEERFEKYQISFWREKISEQRGPHLKLLLSVCDRYCGEANCAMTQFRFSQRFCELARKLSDAAPVDRDVVEMCRCECRLHSRTVKYYPMLICSRIIADRIEEVSSSVANLCVECGCDMGPHNPRQLCGKTYCLAN